MTRLNLTSVVVVHALLSCSVLIHAQQSADWGTQADSLRGKNGQQFSFGCPGAERSPVASGEQILTRTIRRSARRPCMPD